jgi:hypothetical protein
MPRQAQKSVSSDVPPVLLLSLLHALTAFLADFIQREILYRNPRAEDSSVAEFELAVSPLDSGEPVLDVTGSAMPMTSPCS